MNRLIITKWNDNSLTALISAGNVTQLHLEELNQQSLLNNIYIGQVKNIVKNIDAAFVDIGNGQMGYYDLSSNHRHHYTTRHSGQMKEGDEIVVQVSKDSVKTKAPVLSSNLSFTGKYCVLTTGKRQIGFSNKISDMKWKTSMKAHLVSEQEDEFGIIVRTNAKEASAATLIAELRLLKSIYRKLCDEVAYRTCFSLLYQSPPAYVASLRDSYAQNLETIITDEIDMYDCMKEYLTQYQPEDLHKLEFYEDNLISLRKVYSLESALSSAIGKKVWLKSGGYLVIEPTEALVVIDVNTGKYSGKKNVHDTMLKINLEAAREIAKQLRLRNLSGIIIVDFIDMDQEEDRELLMQSLSEAVSEDPVKTTVIGMSKLNLVELTRKKLHKPLHEQLRRIKGDETDENYHSRMR